MTTNLFIYIFLKIGSPYSSECVQQEDSNGAGPELPEPAAAVGNDSNCETVQTLRQQFQGTLIIKSVSTYIHTYIHTYIRAYINILNIHTYTILTYIRIHTYVRTYTYTYTYIHIHTRFSML